MGGADPDRSHSHVAAPQQSADRAERIDRIAVLNDSLRRSICSPGRNQIVMTAGVAALVGDVSLFRGFRRRAEILRTVRNYDSFNPVSYTHLTLPTICSV